MSLKFSKAGPKANVGKEQASCSAILPVFFLICGLLSWFLEKYFVILV